MVSPYFVISLVDCLSCLELQCLYISKCIQNALDNFHTMAICNIQGLCQMTKLSARYCAPQKARSAQESQNAWHISEKQGEKCSLLCFGDLIVNDWAVQKIQLQIMASNWLGSI